TEFQYNILSVLFSLSERGLMDRIFDQDPRGVLRHQSLCLLRCILGQYYPSVAPTDASRSAPGPMDPSGPTISHLGPISDLGASLRPQVGVPMEEEEPHSLPPTRSQ